MVRVALSRPEQSYRTAAALDGARDVLSRPFTGRAHRSPINGVEQHDPKLSFRPRVTNLRDWVLHTRIGDPGTDTPHPPIVAGPDASELRGPMVLVTFHMGALGALGAFLEQLAGEVLVLRMVLPELPRGTTAIGVGGFDEWQRIQTTRRAVAALRRGGFVFLAADGWGTSHVEMKVFDGIMVVTRGAFAIAKLGRAPMVPITARWRGGKLEIVTGDPIPPGNEATMAAALGRWLERYLREHPREIQRPLINLRWRQRSPRAILQQRAEPAVADLPVLGAGYRPPGERDHTGGGETEGGDDRSGDCGSYLLG